MEEARRERRRGQAGMVVVRVAILAMTPGVLTSEAQECRHHIKY